MPSCVVLILAAGFSSRMRGFKPIVPLPIAGGQRSVLDCLVSSYRTAGIRNVLVVSGHRAAEVEAEAQTLGLDWVRNTQPEQGMFSSVRVGLHSLARNHDFCFVHPVDIPLVRPLTLSCLWNARHRYRPAVPTFRQQEGHPLLLPATLWEQASAWQGDRGLQGWLQALPAAHGLARVPVPDRLILSDMDTDAAYARQCRKAQRCTVLEPAECRELLTLHDVPARGLAHGRSVGLVAAALALRLRGCAGNMGSLLAKARPDAALCLSGGLLHDICKGQPKHEQAAGTLLRDLHLPLMANLVEEHRDMRVADTDPVTEKELVYLADKYVQCDRAVTLEERFGKKLLQFGADPGAAQGIQKRWRHAQALEARLQSLLGVSPAVLAQQFLQQRGV